MNTKDLNQPHRRYNALTGDWILVSPHRTQVMSLNQHVIVDAEDYLPVETSLIPTVERCPVARYKNIIWVKAFLDADGRLFLSVLAGLAGCVYVWRGGWRTPPRDFVADS